MSVIIFPIGVYRLIHRLAGRIIVPASSPTLMGLPSDYSNECRKDFKLNDKWKVKRISVEVDGYTIDAVIMGTASTLGNGRWTLASNGNGEFYEQRLQDHSFKQILSELNGNAIVFNYPGVGCSSGMPNRSAMAKAYRAMLNFLEDKENGIGAREIIGYGHSIGGGVQGDALNSHKLKQGVKYCFVKSRTFSDLTTVAEDITGSKFLGLLVWFFGWNMGSVKSSKNLMAPEIIMQSANVTDYTDISEHPERIIDDGIISKKASLAERLLQERQPFLSNKYFMGMPEGHNRSLRNPRHLVDKINDMLQTA